MSKICKKCNVDKELNDFYKHKGICKVCHRQNSKSYRENNRDKTRDRQKRWELKNKEKRKKSRSEQLKEKRKTNPLFAIRSSISRNIRTAILRNGFSKNIKTESILGCSFEEFKLHLESKFENWMNWENRGLYNGEFNYGWDIDHIIPVSSAKTEEEIYKLNHFTNLQPLCSKYNRDLKSNNII
jgi:hypothetical protein